MTNMQNQQEALIAKIQREIINNIAEHLYCSIKAASIVNDNDADEIVDNVYQTLILKAGLSK